MIAARAPAARLIARLASGALGAALAACSFAGCGERVQLGSDGAPPPTEMMCATAACGAPCMLSAAPCDQEPCPPPQTGICDRLGMCVPPGAGSCGDPECEGKSCGDPCWTCPPDQTSCPPPPLMPGEMPRACSGDGQCLQRLPQCG